MEVKWSRFVMSVHSLWRLCFLCVNICVCVCVCVCVRVFVCVLMYVCLSPWVRMLECSWRFYLFRLLIRPSSSSSASIAYGNGATIRTVAATPSMSWIVVIEIAVSIVLAHHIVVTTISHSYWRLFTLTIIFLKVILMMKQLSQITKIKIRIILIIQM